MEKLGSAEHVEQVVGPSGTNSCESTKLVHFKIFVIINYNKKIIGSYLLSKSLASARKNPQLLINPGKQKNIGLLTCIN